jgi:hypothetical protein
MYRCPGQLDSGTLSLYPIVILEIAREADRGWNSSRRVFRFSARHERTNSMITNGFR